MQSSTPDDILLQASQIPQSGLAPALPGTMARAFAGLDPNDRLSDGIKTESPPLDIRPIKDSCAFVRQALQTGGRTYTQPMWNLTTLLATFCIGGEQLAHWMGNKHPGYSPASTDALWDRKTRERKDRNLGWPSCQAIRDAGCTDCTSCPLYGKIRSPLAIVKQAAAAAPIVTAQAALQLAADMALPAGYVVNGQGVICRLIAPKDGDDSEEALIPLPLFYCRLSAPWAQPDAINFTTTIDSVTTRQVCVPLSHFGPQRLYESLIARGVKPVPKQKPHLEEFFMAWLSKLHASPARTSTQFGWFQEKVGSAITGFAIGGKVYLRDNTSLPVNFSDPVLQGYYTATGEEAPWHAAAKALIWDQNRPELEAIVAMAFASPLVKFDGKDSCVLSVWSASGSNKTTALDVGLSVWGHPKFTKETQSSTEKSVRQRMGATRNLPLMWDEITTPQQMAGVRRLLMDASLGIEGGRLHTDATQKTRGEWTTTMTFCANKSIVDSIANHDKGNDALAVRVLEFQAMVPAENAPGRLPDYMASRLTAALRDNYGHVGVRYAQLLAGSVDKIDPMLKLVHASIQKDFQFRGTERFWRSLIATSLVGASLANRIGCKFNIARLRAFYRHIVEVNRARVTDDVMVQGSQPFVSELLNQFLAHHVDRSVWTDRHPGRRGGQVGIVNTVYVPRDVQARLRAPVVQWVEEGQLLIVRAEFDAWLHRIFEDPPASAIYKALKEHYRCVTEQRTLCAYTPYTRSQERLLVIPVDTTTDLWPLMRSPPKPEDPT